MHTCISMLEHAQMRSVDLSIPSKLISFSAMLNVAANWFGMLQVAFEDGITHLGIQRLFHQLLLIH